MSAARAKRQFAGAAADPAQRQITSFFPKAPDGITTPTASVSQPSHAPLQGPVLPASVQADLLNVGMRIRKAVPEGYKMSGATSVFKLWTDTATTAAEFTTTTTSSPPVNRSSAASVARELLPFCGINKIGGMAAQPQPELHQDSDSDDADDDVPALEDVPEFTISQESVDSDDFCETSRKRGFDEEEDDDSEGARHGFVDVARVIAIPRMRLLKGGEDQAMAVVDDDFEEASFLVFHDPSAQMDLSD